MARNRLAGVSVEDLLSAKRNLQQDLLEANTVVRTGAGDTSSETAKVSSIEEAIDRIDAALYAIDPDTYARPAFVDRTTIVFSRC